MSYNRQMRVEKTEDYKTWIDSLRDQSARSRVLVRVDRLIHGNPGEFRNLTEGVSELKIDFGPGYRVYFSKKGNTLLLLLAGGDKSSQAKDIAKALELNRNFAE
jgi:putative addiction module killer protein